MSYVMRKTTPPVHRIMRRVVLEDHGFDTRCWVRPGGTASYWTTSRGRREDATTAHLVAHRLVYERFVGKIPEGYELDHLCRVRGCVCPTHLEPVTPYENQRRGLNMALKTHCKYGHELTEENSRRFVNNRGHRCRECRTCRREGARK